MFGQDAREHQVAIAIQTLPFIPVKVGGVEEGFPLHLWFFSLLLRAGGRGGRRIAIEGAERAKHVLDKSEQLQRIDRLA